MLTVLGDMRQAGGTAAAMLAAMAAVEIVAAQMVERPGHLLHGDLRILPP